MAMLWLALVFAAVVAAAAPAAAAPAGEGAKTFVARPVFGAARFELPARVTWRSTQLKDGRYHVELGAEVDVRGVLANVKPLSARALDRDIQCNNRVRVQAAAARLLAPRALSYDVRFHYTKRVCAGGLPLELPAEVTCSARILLAAARAIVTIDVQGATAPPCRISGAATGVSDAITALVGIDVFKRHTLDLAKLLPKEFQGVTIDIRTLGFDLPPKAAVLHIAGESTMSQAQHTTLMARLSATPATN
jgi:hypothetical protein